MDTRHKSHLNLSYNKFSIFPKKGFQKLRKFNLDFFVVVSFLVRILWSKSEEGTVEEEKKKNIPKYGQTVICIRYYLLIHLLDAKYNLGFRWKCFWLSFVTKFFNLKFFTIKNKEIKHLAKLPSVHPWLLPSLFPIRQHWNP